MGWEVGGYHKIRGGFLARWQGFSMGRARKQPLLPEKKTRHKRVPLGQKVLEFFSFFAVVLFEQFQVFEVYHAVSVDIGGRVPVFIARFAVKGRREYR